MGAIRKYLPELYECNWLFYANYAVILGSFDGIVWAAMALFYTDSVTLAYSNVQAAKQWWIGAFDCKEARVPPEWDCPLPSDVALQLPGHTAPTILLNARAEVEEAGFERPSPVVSVIFCASHDSRHSRWPDPRRWRYAVLRNSRHRGEPHRNLQGTLGSECNCQQGVTFFGVDDDRRFLYALTVGCAVSGLLFWLAFWHGRVLLGTAWGLAVCVLLWFRYGGPSYCNRLQRHGTRQEIQRFKATVVIFALVVVAAAVVLAVEGLQK